MDEIDYFEVFGVENGANEQEATEPAPAETETGAEEPEVTEPAGVDNTSEEAEAEEPKQSDEDNAKYAAARRKAERERDEAIARIRAEARKEIDDSFASAGLTNPYNGKPITSKAEYDAYKKEYDKELKKNVVKRSGMTDEEFKRFVNELPEVKQARMAAEAAQRQQAEARKAQEKAEIDAQIREISGYDPAIQSVHDLSKMENFDKFCEKVKRGYTFADSYMLVNFDKIAEQKAQAAKTAEGKKRAGKEHLSSTSTRGSGAQTVPADVMEQYRLLMPDITDAEIRDHYNTHHRRE